MKHQLQPTLVNYWLVAEPMRIQIRALGSTVWQTVEESPLAGSLAVLNRMTTIYDRWVHSVVNQKPRARITLTIGVRLTIGNFIIAQLGDGHSMVQGFNSQWLRLVDLHVPVKPETAADRTLPLFDEPQGIQADFGPLKPLDIVEDRSAAQLAADGDSPKPVEIRELHRPRNHKTGCKCFMCRRLQP
jgi:hypothetical protein